MTFSQQKTRLCGAGFFNWMCWGLRTKQLLVAEDIHKRIMHDAQICRKLKVCNTPVRGATEAGSKFGDLNALFLSLGQKIYRLGLLK